MNLEDWHYLIYDLKLVLIKILIKVSKKFSWENAFSAVSAGSNPDLKNQCGQVFNNI